MMKDASQNEKSGAKPQAASKHPLIGALKGLSQVAPGQDLTEAADPGWGESR